MRLKDQVAIITGSSLGIGKSVAEVFAQEGAKIVVNYNASESGALVVVNDIQKKGGPAISVKADVSNVEDAKRLVKTSVDKFGRIDILVNNAGVCSSTILSKPKRRCGIRRWTST